MLDRVVITTSKNSLHFVISSNFLVRKFCKKAKCPHSFGRIARIYAEFAPFRKIFIPGNQVKLRYFSQCTPLFFTPNILITQGKHAQNQQAFQRSSKSYVHPRPQRWLRIFENNLQYKTLTHQTLCEKYPNMELYLVRIQSEHRKVLTRNNSVFRLFLHGEK